MSMQEPCALCGVVEWAYGVKYERERIIKLLEGLDDWGSIGTAFVPELIALIKGENNG